MTARRERIAQKVEQFRIDALRAHAKRQGTKHPAEPTSDRLTDCESFHVEALPPEMPDQPDMLQTGRRRRYVGGKKNLKKVFTNRAKRR